jgi:hypothetical protein
MKVIDVPQNTRVFLGVPAKPLPASFVLPITNALYGLDGVEELYLPQCFALGVMSAPGPVIVVIVGAKTSLSRIGRQTTRLVTRLVPAKQTIDVWPIRNDSSFASAVRQTNCFLERDPFSLPPFRKRQPWWRRLLLDLRRVTGQKPRKRPSALPTPSHRINSEGSPITPVRVAPDFGQNAGFRRIDVRGG